MLERTAFVHDRIVHLWGAEEVFMDLIRTYWNRTSPIDDAHFSSPKRSSLPLEQSENLCIFTLFSPRQTLTIDGQKIPVIVALPRWLNAVFVRGSQPAFTRLQKLRAKLFDYRNLIIFAPTLVWLLRRKIRAYAPQLLVISSFAAVKNIVLPNQKTKNTFSPQTILYLHSPMQYIHENYDEYLKKLAPRQVAIFKPTAKRLRTRDLHTRTYSYVFTNSGYTANCAQTYYTLSSRIRYPRIDKYFLQTAPSSQPREYYVYVGRLVRFIREADLVIHLFNQLHLPLLVMWSWPDEIYLKSIAGDTITFLWQVSDIKDRVEIVKHARGLINLTKESCGMGTMEALALGVPVFGVDAGATPELVDGDSGYLTKEKNINYLQEEFQKFSHIQFDREIIKAHFLKKYAPEIKT